MAGSGKRKRPPSGEAAGTCSGGTVYQCAGASPLGSSGAMLMLMRLARVGCMVMYSYTSWRVRASSWFGAGVPAASARLGQKPRNVGVGSPPDAPQIGIGLLSHHGVAGGGGGAGQAEQ